MLIVSSGNAFRSQPQKKLYVSPPSASRIQLPDGRYIAYHEQGVAVKDARFSVMVPHSFLSSRFAGALCYCITIIIFCQPFELIKLLFSLV